MIHFTCGTDKSQNELIIGRNKQIIYIYIYSRQICRVFLFFLSKNSQCMSKIVYGPRFSIYPANSFSLLRLVTFFFFWFVSSPCKFYNVCTCNCHRFKENSTLPPTRHAPSTPPPPPCSLEPDVNVIWGIFCGRFVLFLMFTDLFGKK